MILGVEKNNDDAQCSYFSSNFQDPISEILKAETRVQQHQHSREKKRPYKKRYIPEEKSPRLDMFQTTISTLLFSLLVKYMHDLLKKTIMLDVVYYTYLSNSASSEFSSICIKTV